MSANAIPMCIFHMCPLCASNSWRRATGLAKYMQDGFTALMWAARFGKVDCARLLLDSCADSNATDKVRLQNLVMVITRKNEIHDLD